MKWSTGGIGVHALIAELLVFGLVTNKRARYHHFLAANKDNFLAGKKLLRNNGTKSSIEVVAAVDNDGLFENHDEI